jgi:hypothetical protein
VRFFAFKILLFKNIIYEKTFCIGGSGSLDNVDGQQCAESEGIRLR